MAILLFLLSSILTISCLSSPVSTVPCDISAKVNPIPASHLYAKKTKPLVIGHHGNPSKYQENTVDGFKSLSDIKADGMALDTYLTKDKQLVVIHYDNTMTLTNKSHYIWDTTYDELQKLSLPTELKYGAKPIKFDKPRKIPLLSEVINAVKDKELVMYININPSYVQNRTESAMVGKEVAKLVTKLDVVDNVLLASFDSFKILAAKEQNPDLVVGTFYKTSMWNYNTANDMKSQFGDLPGMQKCVQEAPNGTEFMNFLFRNGALLKSTNGSFVVMDYEIYNNDQYSTKNTFQTFKDNYRPDLSFGAFVIDNLKLTDEERKNDEKYLDLLITNNASCLFTDDVPRLLKKLGRSPEKPTTKGFANKNLPAPLVLSAIFLFIWFLR